MKNKTESTNLCCCGCGQPVNPGRSFIKGHNNRGKPSPLKVLPTTPAPFCECGCGEKVRWNESRRRWNRYIKGHEHIGRTHSKESIEKMREKAKARADIVAETNRKRVWTAESRKKLSDAKKRNPLPQRFNCGDSNPCFKHGKPYLRPSYPVIFKIRRELIEKRGFLCEHCDEVPSMPNLLHMHHIDENPFNNDFDNLKLLCVSCHSKITHNTL